jgi:transposase
MGVQRKVHSAGFKAKVALAAHKADRAVNQLAGPHDVHPTQIHARKKITACRSGAIFANGAKSASADAREGELYEQIGRLRMEMEWLKTKVSVEHARPLLLPGDARRGLEPGTPRGVPHGPRGAIHGGGVHGPPGVGRGGVSMDGRGRVLDNVSVKLFCRAVKYDDAYIRGYEQVSELWLGLSRFFGSYIHAHLHQVLSYRTPAVYAMPVPGDRRLAMPARGG